MSRIMAEIVPSPDAPRIHTARGRVAFVTRDTDGLFYVWHVYRGETGWLYAYRAKTAGVAKCRQLGRHFRPDTMLPLTPTCTPRRIR